MAQTPEFGTFRRMKRHALSLNNTPRKQNFLASIETKTQEQSTSNCYQFPANFWLTLDRLRMIPNCGQPSQSTANTGSSGRTKRKRIKHKRSTSKTALPLPCCNR